MSELVSAGMLSVRDAVCAAEEMMAFIPLAPSDSWFVAFVRLRAANEGLDVTSMSCGVDRMMDPLAFVTLT